MKKRTLLFLVVIIFLLLGINQNLLSQVLEQDSLALVALYDSTDGVNWTDNTNWLTGPVSNWFGITVSDGRVTDVVLRSNNLVGTIPVEIGNLTELLQLDFYKNQLTDSIPSEIGNLVNLTLLNFHNNQLVGNIPSELGNLTNLQDAYIRNNQLTGPIPPEIGNLTNLEDLYLNGNQLTDSIPSEIGNLISLRNLNLYGNNLSGNIPAELYNLMNLTYLSLSNNNLTGSISPDIGKLVNLESLYLSGNMLTDSIPAEISNLKDLRVLNLRFNQLSGTIPMELYSLTNLATINLSRNQITGAIPPQIGNLVNLTEFSVPENQMYGDIPYEIGNLLDLESLWLNDNKFAGAIPNGIGKMTYLRRLRLENNQLTDLPDLSSDTSLTDVQIQNNQFTFEDIEPSIGIEGFIYSPQDSVGEELDTTISQGSSIVLSVSVGGTANHYQWMLDGIDISGADSSSYLISSAESADEGSYLCKITNTIATDLTLYSRPINLTVLGEVGITDHLAQIPKTFSFSQNYPNPFTQTTTIQYILPQPVKVNISIYNMLGQKVKVLKNIIQQVGTHKVQWDGKDEYGNQNTSGIYICHIKAGECRQSIRLMLMK
jgi:Leucine-rich repeat (LRR) protein